MKYRPEIDGLRAFAIIPVILFHSGIDVFSGGYIGVDIFFVISGYLITTIILNDLKKQKFSFLKFYERRIRRLLPVLIFICIFTLIFAVFIFLPSQLVDLSYSILSVLFFFSNIYFWKTTGYFDGIAEEKPLLHTWSLSIEEQFYIFFPIILLILFKYYKKKLLHIYLIFFFLSLLLCLYAGTKYINANFYSLPTRAWELLLGSILAIIIFEYGKKTNKTISLMSFFVLLICFFSFDEYIITPGPYLLIPTLSVFFIIYYYDTNSGLNNILANKIVLNIGLMSYSLYLWHQVIFSFYKSQFKILNFSSLSLILIIVYCLSFFTWKFIETPFRNKNSISFKVLLKIILFLSFCLFLSCSIIISLKGFYNYQISTQTEKNQTLLKSIQSSPMRTKCHNEKGLNYQDSCEYFDGKLKVAVIGDSFVNETAYVLAKNLVTEKIKVKHLSFPGCPPLREQIKNNYDKHCIEWLNQNLTELKADARIKTVVVNYNIYSHIYAAEIKYPTQPRFRTTESFTIRDHILKSYLFVINELIKANKSVIIILPPPPLPFSVQEIILKSKNSGNLNGVDYKWFLNYSDFIKNNLEFLDDKIEIIDPAKYLCNKKTCFAGKNEIAYYFDHVHLTLNGVKLYAEELSNLVKNNLK